MTRNTDTEHLRQFTFFRDLPEADLLAINECLHEKVAPARSILLTADQPGTAVYFLLEGTIKVFCNDGSRDVILAILGNGQTFGEMSLVDSLGRSASVITMEESRFYWMDRESFGEFLNRSPSVALAVARHLSQRLRVADARIRAMSALDVRGRVARQLLTFCVEYGQPTADGFVRIPFRLTQSDLADLVGATRVRVNQVIQNWKETRTLDVDDNERVTIRNRAALAKACRDVPA